jgi:hypothetical protein
MDSHSSKGRMAAWLEDPPIGRAAKSKRANLRILDYDSIDAKFYHVASANR